MCSSNYYNYACTIIFIERETEYDCSLREGKPTRTMIKVCKMCSEDMDYLNYPQMKKGKSLTINKMQKILHDFITELM